MGVVIGLTTEQQVEFDLILSGMVEPTEAKKITKSIFEDVSNKGKKPFKAVAENPDFMTVTTVDGGIELNFKINSISAYLPEEGNTKIFTDKLDINARGSVQEFEAFMSQHILEHGCF